MKLIMLTSAHTGRPIAIDAELIGEVRDLTGNLCQKHGKTLIVHKANRRVKWTVNEAFEEVMGRIAENSPRRHRDTEKRGGEGARGRGGDEDTICW